MSTKTGHTLGGMFLPYQLDWINDESARKLGDKARRTGWTYCEAYDAVSRRFRSQQPRESDYWFSSADESAAFEFIEYCRFYARDLFGRVADYFVEDVPGPDSKATVKAFGIVCPSGHRITGMSSSPRRFRSKGGDVTLDEYAHHDDPEAMYDAAEPTARLGDKLSVFSNCNGEGSQFDKYVKACKKVLRALGLDPEAVTHHVVDFETMTAKARELRLSPIFSYHRVTISQAIEQGLVERVVNRKRGVNYTRDGYLQFCRDSARNEEAFQQESNCTPAMNLAAALKYSVIEAVMSELCPRPDEPLAGYLGGPCFIGADIGSTQDKSCFWTWEQVGDVLWTRQIKKLAATSMVDQETELAAMVDSVKTVRCTILKRGVGIGIYDHMTRRYGTRISGLDETLGNKVGMIVGCIQAYEDKRVRIPMDDDLKESLHSVREIRTPGGQISYAAPRTEAGHADDFSAGAAGIDGATSDQIVPMEFHSAGKLQFSQPSITGGGKGGWG